ncbi:MAG TPA: hypothetical protein VJX67_11875 [Blastocatellia bacterium]|nr:hypothetical protein [Blastocatellia bacterium]
MDRTDARKVRAMLQAFDEIEGHAHMLELKIECQRAVTRRLPQSRSKTS